MEKRRITSEIADELYERIEGFPDKARIQLRKEAESLNETNCGWLEYKLKDFILSATENIGLRREPTSHRTTR